MRLDLVQKVSRQEVLARCARAHVVVDQLLLGWYGGFAVESMASGRPVLAYVRRISPRTTRLATTFPSCGRLPRRWRTICARSSPTRRVAAKSVRPAGGSSRPTTIRAALRGGCWKA